MKEDSISEIVDLDADKALLRLILDCIYIEDCHVSGTHDPDHTPNYVCSLQLQAMAKRVLTVLYGIDWRNKESVSEKINQVPRRINKTEFSWYLYYKKHGPAEKASTLERWEKEGYGPKN